MKNMTIEELLCNEMYKFFKSRKNLSKVKADLKANGFNSNENFLKSISTDVQDAAWCLCELLNWGMDEQDMDAKWIHETVLEDGYTKEIVYKGMDGKRERYFVVHSEFINNCYTYKVKEVEKITKLVEVIEWCEKE